MPMFSVVMPTRNRAEMLVGTAMKSVIEQTFEDFELVVCDNASSDDTRQRVEAMGDPRIKFFRSEEWIPKEKFFEWSMGKARGEYATLFFDDDMMTTWALEKANLVLTQHEEDLLAYSRSLTYHFSNWYADSFKNRLTIPVFTGKLFRQQSRRHLAMVYEVKDILPDTPMVTNAFFRTTFFHHLVERYGSLFPQGHMGDYNIACFTLDNTSDFLYLDDPLVLFGHWKDNTSQQLHDLQTTMPEYQEWIQWAKEELITRMPARAYLWPNCVAAALIEMNELLELDLEVSTDKYFFDLQHELSNLEMLGVDVLEQKEECYRALSQMPQQIRESVIHHTVHGWTPKLTNIKEELSLDSARTIPPSSNNHSLVVLNGDEWGFNDIQQAGDFFESVVRGETKSQKDTGDSGAEAEKGDLVENFMQVLKDLDAGPHERFFLVGATQIARHCFNVLGQKVTALSDSRMYVKECEFAPGLQVDWFEVLGTEDYDCVLVSVPMVDDLKQRLIKTVESGPSKGAEVVYLNDLIPCIT